MPATAQPARDWQAAARLARGDWLLLMQAGDAPGANWVQALERHALTARGQPGLLPRAGWRGALDRAFPPARAGAGFVMTRGALIAGTAARPRILAVSRHG